MSHTTTSPLPTHQYDSAVDRRRSRWQGGCLDTDVRVPSKPPSRQTQSASVPRRRQAARYQRRCSDIDQAAYDQGSSGDGWWTDFTGHQAPHSRWQRRRHFANGRLRVILCARASGLGHIGSKLRLEPRVMVMLVSRSKQTAATASMLPPSTTAQTMALLCRDAQLPLDKLHRSLAVVIPAEQIGSHKPHVLLTYYRHLQRPKQRYRHIRMLYQPPVNGIALHCRYPSRACNIPKDRQYC